jgi:hypothetical protein
MRINDATKVAEELKAIEEKIDSLDFIAEKITNLYDRQYFLFPGDIILCNGEATLNFSNIDPIDWEEYYNSLSADKISQ